MFTEKAQAVIDRAKGYAVGRGGAELDLPALVAAFAADSEGCVLMADALDLTPDAVRARVGDGDRKAYQGKLPLAEPVRAVIATAQGFAVQTPDRSHPGLVDVRHLAYAVATSGRACEPLRVSPRPLDRAAVVIAGWYRRQADTPRLDELTERLRALRAGLLDKVFGQDHAVHAFVEGLFNAEVVAASDSARRNTRAVFVFAGPPGVGKTYLAELGSAHLARPFKRFDMSAFSSTIQAEALVGMAPSFHGAHPGALTEFVEKNPTAVLLFDEVEKAHPRVIQLFLQVLDAGTLEDKFHERAVGFRDTTIIFTTNAGRKLYERSAGGRIGAQFHRRTVLDALGTEKDQYSGQPSFPAAICSRLATGYPVLFNHLGVTELERVVRAELTRTAGLIERQYFKRVTFDDALPVCLILREGVEADARALRAQAECFLKAELYGLCQLFKAERLEDAVAGVEQIHIEVRSGVRAAGPEVRAMFEPADRPQVLLVASRDLAGLYARNIPGIDWRAAPAPADAWEALASGDVDWVLLDLFWCGAAPAGAAASMQGFDHVPAASRRLDEGQELLRHIRDRLPDLPVYLLSPAGGEQAVDEELLLSCVRTGGVRGLVTTGFSAADDGPEHRDRLAADLADLARRLHREHAAARIGQERKALAFDTAPLFDPNRAAVTVRVRNLRLSRAVAAADAGEVLAEVERPRTTFDDVVGADAAKDELRFFIDYLRNPKRFSVLGLKPPKGVLLHGPPGTGKTLLARAMAGESEVAFLAAAASSFVTVWQGSGPQNIRDIFVRARRYAPAVVFIDEIDAIGRTRTGGPGGNQAAENTLNALLTEMDGFLSASVVRPVFVLAATNSPVTPDVRDDRTLDPSLVRRFSRVIRVELPEKATRLKYLTARLANRPGCEVTAEAVARLGDRSAGMSIANLEGVIEAAARAALKQSGVLTGDVLEEAFETVQFGEAHARTPEMVRRAAYHEAGHVVLSWLSGWLPAYVTVVSRGGHGGYMTLDAEEMERRSVQTCEELLGSIRIGLGGRAGELVAFGEREGMTTGATTDLEVVNQLARQMVCRFGMDPGFGLLTAPELVATTGQGGLLAQQANEAVRRLLGEQLERSLTDLLASRVHLDAVAQALIKRERLTREDLRLLLPPS